MRTNIKFGEVVFYFEKKNIISNHNFSPIHLLFVRFDFSAEILSDKSSMERWQKATEIDISSFFPFKLHGFSLDWNSMHCHFPNTLWHIDRNYIFLISLQNNNLCKEKYISVLTWLQLLSYYILILVCYSNAYFFYFLPF